LIACEADVACKDIAANGYGIKGALAQMPAASGRCLRQTEDLVMFTCGAVAASGAVRS